MAVAAPKAGASRVHAIEASGIAKVAFHVFEANGVADRITLIEGYSTRILPPGRTDARIAEVIGNDFAALADQAQGTPASFHEPQLAVSHWTAPAEPDVASEFDRAEPLHPAPPATAESAPCSCGFAPDWRKATTCPPTHKRRVTTTTGDTRCLCWRARRPCNAAIRCGCARQGARGWFVWPPARDDSLATISLSCLCLTVPTPASLDA